MLLRAMYVEDGMLLPLYRPRMLTVSHGEAHVRARELAPATTRDIVRLFAATAVGVTVWLSVIDVWRVGYELNQKGGVRAAILAALVTIPLHVRHLLYGVRGERPPAGAWTLALLALVTLSGVFFVGNAWAFEFAPLVVSIMIVMRGRAKFLCAAIVIVLPFFFFEEHWYSFTSSLSGVYLAMAVAWRSASQYVPLRLLASIHALEAANRELEARAVVQTRVRIDGELRTSVGSALQQIVARGEVARATAKVSSTQAVSELRALVADSRRALADARRIVAGYRAPTLRGELDAATALLEATGARVRRVVADDIALDTPDEHTRAAIRSSLAKALRDEPRSSYVLRLARSKAGALEIEISSEAS